MARRSRIPKEKKRKRVTVKLIHREVGGKVTEPYKIMESIVKTERADLKRARIGMAWRSGWRPDPHGVLKLGQCKKRGDLERELAEYDFIILLNEESFQHLKSEEKRRLIFHELMHAEIVTEAGEDKLDDRGRLVCRVRKHDVEDFREVVKQFGWQEDLSQIAQQRNADASRPLLDGQEES